MHSISLLSTMISIRIMFVVIVKISIPKVKIAVLKNLPIFGEKYLPQSVRLLEGGGELKRYSAEFRLNMQHPCVGLPLLVPVNWGPQF